MVATLLLGIIIVVLVLLKLCSKPANFPPGPPRWPVIGNLIEMKSGGLVYQVAAHMARKYGEVSGLYLGSEPVIIVSSLEAIKEASVREDLSGRTFEKIEHYVNLGIIQNQGEVWKEQRRFALRHLRDLGLGKRSMEGIIHEEVHCLLTEIARMAGHDWSTTVELHEVLGTSGINVLWHIMAGQRYAHSDEQFRKLIEVVKVITKLAAVAGGLADCFPGITKLIAFLPNTKKLRESRQNVNKYVMEDIIKHRETLDTENPRDFIDLYLIEMCKQSHDPNSSFTEQQLIAVCRNLFNAGTDTTFNSVTFALVYMVRHPHVQQKVQDEIDRVVGRDRLPSLEDRDRLVYTEATIFETLRLSSVVPLAVPHAPLLAQQNVAFRGFVIPKNARVLLNLAYVHMDPKIWGDPENFRPERFISPEGKLTRSDALIAFGLGKRQCLGESLARNNLLLFFSAIMQRYSLHVPPGEKPPSLQATGGFTLGPQHFRATVKPRFISL